LPPALFEELSSDVTFDGDNLSCRTGRKPEECLADMEILIKQAISAMPKIFEKLSLSSDP